MPLAPLAEVTDLPAVWQLDTDAAEKALVVASTAIRDAAGHPISETTATATVTGTDGALLALPSPVRAVTAVAIDGTAVTDYKALPEGLWRACGWSGCGPSAVTVSATFGFAEVPADIVDLTVQLAVSSLEHNASGGGLTAGVSSVRIDDAAESYTDEAANAPTPSALPESTRTWLRARFGGSAIVVEATL